MPLPATSFFFGLKGEEPIAGNIFDLLDQLSVIVRRDISDESNASLTIESDDNQVREGGKPRVRGRGGVE